MNDLYPMKFAPLFQERAWAGRRLGDLFGWDMPRERRIGEAWLLSDRADMASRVVNGACEGETLSALLAKHAEAMLGTQHNRFQRFPLLLKFLDVGKTLSVQVHPSDDQREFLPPGEMGKTEGWVMLRAPGGTRIYAGVRAGVTRDELRHLSMENVDERIASFEAREGEGVLVEARMVHALGAGAVVFEIQENSDVTFRLFDWDTVDPRTGMKRPLHVEQALACLDLSAAVARPPDAPSAAARPSTLVLDCRYFRVWRITATRPVEIGGDERCRVCVCLRGSGTADGGASTVPCRAGDVILFPALLSRGRFCPDGEAEILEIEIPEAA